MVDHEGSRHDMAADYPVLQMRPGREFAAGTCHPWLFSRAFAEMPQGIDAGTVADVPSSTGEWVARGHLNPKNSLAFRALTLDPKEDIDEEFYIRRLARAQRLRALLPANLNAYRLVHAEADYLPGLIVDRYDRWLVAQFHTAGVEQQREAIIAALRRGGAPGGVLVRDHTHVRERAGL